MSQHFSNNSEIQKVWIIRQGEEVKSNWEFFPNFYVFLIMMPPLMEFSVNNWPLNCQADNQKSARPDLYVWNQG